MLPPLHRPFNHGFVALGHRVGQVVRIGEHEGQIDQILPAAVILRTRAGMVYVPAGEFARGSSTLIDDEGAS